MTKKRPLLLLSSTITSLALGAGINVIDAPGTMVWFTRRSGGTLDTNPQADAAGVHALLERMGDDGRALYLQEIVGFDIAFPIALLLMVHLAIVQAWTTRTSSTTLRRLLLVPWAAFAIDLCENASAFALTSTFPREPTALAGVIGSITTLKFIVYGAGLVIAVVGAALSLSAARRAPGGSTGPT